MAIRETRMNASRFRWLAKACGLQCALFVLALSLPGCPIPLGLQPESERDDGGVPAAPAVLSTDPRQNAEITLSSSTTEQRTISATIEDVNGGSLFAELFLDPDLDPPPPPLLADIRVNQLTPKEGVAPRWKVEASINPCRNRSPDQVRAKIAEKEKKRYNRRASIIRSRHVRYTEQSEEPP
jgi:hypothetical protein